MFSADHENVPTVAVGDDLFLEILRRLAAAQKRIEGGPQALFLPAQPIPNLRQRRARVVGHVARRFDLPPHIGDLGRKRCDGVDLLAEDRKRGSDFSDHLARLLNRLEIIAKLQEPERFERSSVDGERVEDGVEIRRRAKWKPGVIVEEAGALGGGALQRDDARCLSEGMQLCQPGLAGRRDGEARDHFNYAIELESPQGARMHGDSGWKGRARTI